MKRTEFMNQFEMSKRVALSVLGAVIAFSPMALTLRAEAPDLQWTWKGFNRERRFAETPHLQALAANSTYQTIWSGICDTLAASIGERANIQESVSALLLSVPSSDVFLQVWTDGETVSAFNLAVRGEPVQMALVTGAAQGLGWEESVTGSLKGAPESSWRVKSHSPEGGRLEITGFGEWTLVRFQNQGGFRGGSLLENILVHNRPWGEPTEALISVALTPAALQTPRSAATAWSRIEFDLALDQTKTLLSGSIEFDEAPEIDFADWRLPLEAIRDPLASFTAIRNPTEWLPLPKSWIAPLPIEVRSNEQYYLWSEDHGWSMPYVTRFATTFKGDSKTWLDGFSNRLIEKLSPLFSDKGIGQLTKNSEPLQLNWLGIPLLIPHLRAENGESGSFLIGGFLPLNRYTNEPPEELLSAIQDSKNLVYYDWEITPVRFRQATSIKGKLRLIYDIATRTSAAGAVASTPTTAQASWVGLGEAINEGAANAITTISADTPTRWTFTRRSGFGLTALEIVLGLTWLEEIGALEKLKNQPSDASAIPIPTPR